MALVYAHSIKHSLMQLVETFQWVALFTFGGFLALAQQHIQAALRQFIGHQVEITDPSLVSSIGQILQIHGRVTTWSLMENRTPGKGIHILWFDRTLHFIFMGLTTSEKPMCHVFSLWYYPQGLIDAAQLHLTKMATMEYAKIRTGYKTARLGIPQTQFPWQRACGLAMIDKWLHPRPGSMSTCTSILIAGPAGTGKSVMTRVLYQLMVKEHGIVPIIYNARFERNESIFIDSTIRLDIGQPVIVLADEIDVLMKQCTTEERPSRWSTNTIADGAVLDKRDLCEWLDAINGLPNSFLVATTNVSLETLQQDYPHFVRPGRLNMKTTFEESAIQAEADD